METCYICKEELNKKHIGAVNTKVCYDCRGKNLFISKTAAKKDYKLTDIDLTSLFNFQVKSMKYNQLITLFVKSEVEKLSEILYDGELEEILDEKEQKKEINRKKREKKHETDKNIRKIQVEKIFEKYGELQIYDNILNDYIDKGFKYGIIETEEQLEEKILLVAGKKRREIEVVACLEKKGISMRNDSKLCQAYIDGGLEAVKKINNKYSTLDEIIDTMEEMHFYYQYTNYKNILQDKIDNNRNQSYYDKEDISYLIDDSKFDALKKYIISGKDLQYIPASLDVQKNIIINISKKIEY
jgi:hypothetical protein